jgi:dTMP kinase
MTFNTRMRWGRRSVTAVSGPVYVALEGAEGCGKSTQAALLAEAIGAVLTRETGGTAVGARLREILHDTTVDDLDDRAEALIAAADRAQHVAHVVRPALAAGRCVVSDRSVYSTLAYQGYGRGLDVGELRRINDWAIGGLWPHRVVLLDAATEVLTARISERELDRFERAGDDFHARVAAGFRAMAADDPERWSVVDADGDVATVAKRVRAVVEDWVRR